MKKLLYIYFAILFASCDLINPEEEIPAFIRIDQIILDTRQPGDPGYTVNEGSSSSNISDAWIFVNDNLDGVYELPAQIPVVGGMNTFRVSPGIKNNGVSSDRTIYPFFDDFLIDLDLVPEETQMISPVIQYFENSVVFWHEDFEDPGVKIENLNLTDTTIQRIFNDPIVFEGLGCGSIPLTETATFYKGQTIANLDIAPNSTLYMELDYLTNNSFQIGIRNDNIAIFEVPHVGLNPTFDENDELVWKKIYIKFDELLMGLGDQGDWEIFFEAQKEVAQPQILIDNIKIVHNPQ